MKKNVLYVLMMACMFSFFTACGDDDKDDDGNKPEETTWKDAIGTYKDSGDKVLTIEGAKPATDKTFVLVAGSGENAKITLNNMVPEAAAVEIDNVTMNKANNDYSFSGETKVGSTTIGVTGTMKGLPATKAEQTVVTIDIKVTRTIDAAIAGTWKLGMGGSDEAPIADFRIDTDMQLPDPIGSLFSMDAISGLVGGLIGQKVSTVNLKLSNDGLFDVSWVQQGATEEINYVTAIKELMAGNPNIPAAVAPIVEEFLKTVGYFTKDDKFYLTFNKGIIDIALPMMADILPEGLTPEAIISLFEVSGNYYYLLPLNMTKDDNGTFFYMGKNEIIPILAIAMPLLGGLTEKIPAELLPLIEPLLEQLPSMIAASSKFNIGLGFVK